MRLNLRSCFLLLFLFSCPPLLRAQENIVYSTPDKNVSISNRIEILEDKSNTFTIDQVLHSPNFKKSKLEVPNLEISTSSFWIRFSVTNNTKENLAVELPYPTIDSVCFIKINSSGPDNIIRTGEFLPQQKRIYKHQNYIFDLNIAPYDRGTFLIKISASEQIQVPLTLGTTKSILQADTTKDLLFGLYAGIILVMFFYNLFIYFTVRDKTYLYYVFYILFAGFTQACLQGYANRFLYQGSAYLANLMMVVVPVFVGVFALGFLMQFMLVKKYTPTLYKVLFIFLFVYLVVLVLGFLQYYRLCAQIVQINAGIASIFVVIIGTKIALKGYKPATFFLVAWSIFLASVVVFVLRNFGILPYNNFTYYALQIGSALEIVLLSFALADKINTFRREKEESQAQTLSALQENEKIIREQNVVLEAKVTNRTVELQASNTELNKTLHDLKEAESHLVESEKMASLGQLTAGIAHEINNPINFVTSNVKPLKRDVSLLLDVIQNFEEISVSGSTAGEKQKMINDYKAEIDYDYLKEEIDHLLNGISDGASRTAEIVKGLRIFSRLDEDDLKKADINEGIDSTLVITNNLLNNRIELVKEYNNLPLVECYPGKLNQVFLNIISNGIYAVSKKYGDQHGGVLKITTTHDEKNVIIKLSDNGTGMDETTKKKLFEPFFTTKEVGEGTGLGLSIVYNTIVKHNGAIFVDSVVGEGTTFTIQLPIVHERLN